MDKLIKQLAPNTLPPLLEKHQELCVWIINKVRKFPKDLRYDFGHHLSHNTLCLMDLLVQALYESNQLNKVQLLEKCSICIEQLRLQLRMAYTLRLLNARALHYATHYLHEEGQMLGGWLKMQKKRTTN